MNCTYRSIWNDTTGTFVAASENAKSTGKKTSSGSHSTGLGARFSLQTLALCVALSFGATSYALPTGGVVAAGSASINTGVAGTTINQSTQNAAINWQSFNIAAGESVRFNQPSSSSVTLNQVLGADPSGIFGSLTANGKVFLVNPNGILFGQGASVNVGGLVASTLNIADGDFMAGNYKFTGVGNGTVANQGSINADGGFVALLGANVANNGVISAKLGTVALAAGNAITLDVVGDGLLNVTVNQGAVNALVQNGGLIQADGGQVLLTAQAAGSLLQSAVNNTGVIQAQTIQNHNGTIRLMGDMQSGTVNVGGKLDASAPNGGDGGFVETSAAHVKVADNAIITTQSAQGKSGNWLIDPVDFTIATVGGDITPAALAIDLASNVTINTAAAGTNTATNLYGTTSGVGDINVNSDVTWGTATTLTLNAVHNVNFNANITATTGNLVATAGTDVIVNAMPGTGITMTTTGGNMTWTAGNDIWVKAGVVGGITATGTGPSRANVTWTAGRDINIDSAVTTTDANFTACCGRDINITAAMTTTRGNVLLKAGNEPSAAVPGDIGGTVVFSGAGHYTVTGPSADVTLYYTPTSYSSQHDYSSNFTLSNGATGPTSGAPFTGTAMLVFAKGNDKVYDGNTTATLSLKDTPVPSLGGVGTTVTLDPGIGATATFDTKDVGTGKPITYSGYSLGGTDASNFALWTACVGPTTTSAAITQAPLVVTALDQTKNYGTLFTFTDLPSEFTSIGLKNGETIGSATLTSTGAPATAPVTVPQATGYAIPISNALPGTFNPSNYSITYVPGTMIVNPVPLVLTANDATKVYGTTFTPAGTAFTKTGLVNSDTVTSVAETSTGSAPTASVAGSTYPIVITPGSATGSFTATNYTISYVDGKLAVTPAPLVLTANDATKVYGTTFTPAGTAFTKTGLVNSDTVTSVAETSTGSAPTASVAGSTYPIVITPGSATGSFTPTNYVITYVDGKLTVTPVPLTITANDVTKNYGEAPILSGFTTTPLVNSETVGSVTETSPGQPATAVGGTTYPITPSAATGGTFTPSNYTIGYVNGVLTVLALPPVVPPYEGPNVSPRVTPPTWVPVVVLPGTPPQLLSLVAPVPPVVVAPVLVEEQAPVVVPVETPPTIYVAPHRPRKQDRN